MAEKIKVYLDDERVALKMGVHSANSSARIKMEGGIRSIE